MSLYNNIITRVDHNCPFVFFKFWSNSLDNRLGACKVIRRNETHVSESVDSSPSLLPLLFALVLLLQKEQHNMHYIHLPYQFRLFSYACAH